MKVIKEYVEKMLKKSNNTVDRLIIDDILDISNGLYPTYTDYVDYKQMMIEMIREHNMKSFNKNDGNYKFTYYVEPVILTKDIFCYIVSKNNK